MLRENLGVPSKFRGSAPNPAVVAPMRENRDAKGVWYGEGCPLSSRLGERRELPGGFVRCPDDKRILAYSEGHRSLHLYADALSSLNSATCGDKAEV